MALPRSAFFLFGPRGTGKSTWIRATLEDAFVVNPLQADVMLRYEQEPALLRAEALAQPRNRWTYLGDRELVVDGTRVLPVETFLRRLQRERSWAEEDSQP